MTVPFYLRFYLTLILVAQTKYIYFLLCRCKSDVGYLPSPSTFVQVKVLSHTYLKYLYIPYPWPILKHRLTSNARLFSVTGSWKTCSKLMQKDPSWEFNQEPSCCGVTAPTLPACLCRNLDKCGGSIGTFCGDARVPLELWYYDY